METGKNILPILHDGTEDIDILVQKRMMMKFTLLHTCTGFYFVRFFSDVDKRKNERGGESFGIAWTQQPLAEYNIITS